MKKKRWLLMFLMLFVLALGCSATVQAATKKGWVTVNSTGDKQYYNAKGKLVKNKWVGKKHLNANGFMDRNTWIIEGSKRYYVGNNGNKVTGLVKIEGKYYYFNAKGVNKTGWKKINGKWYYFHSKTRAALVSCQYKFKNGKSYLFNKKGQRLTGWQKIDGNYYYFKPELKKGWLKLNGKTYYLIKAQNGKRAAGIFSVSGKLYYFDLDTGEMLTDTTVTYKDRDYTIDKNGVCTIVPEVSAPTDEMLFFLTFESGSEAYNQTGGDNGCACGAYQFDYRYSLLPFVKYAYETNPVVCEPFKKWAAWANTETNRNKLKSNKTFYKAWNKIYAANPKTFKELQDTFAKINYYDNVERALESVGISVATRSDVVKGAIYSYSIQHGQGSLGNTGSKCGAIGAVQSFKPTSSTTDVTFIKKLYKKRIKDFPAYKTRYESEMALALSLLGSAS